MGCLREPTVTNKKKLGCFWYVNHLAINKDVENELNGKKIQLECGAHKRWVKHNTYSHRLDRFQSIVIKRDL